MPEVICLLVFTTHWPSRENYHYSWWPYHRWRGVFTWLAVTRKINRVVKSRFVRLCCVESVDNFPVIVSVKANKHHAANCSKNVLIGQDAHLIGWYFSTTWKSLKNEALKQCGKLWGSGYSFCRWVGWEAEGSWFRGTPVYLCWGTLEQGTYPPMLTQGPCNELVTHSG